MVSSSGAQSPGLQWGAKLEQQAPRACSRAERKIALRGDFLTEKATEIDQVLLYGMK
jgi:hypothetical protein